MKPDVEMMSETSYRVFFRGRIWDVCQSDSGWAISRNMEVFHKEQTAADAIAWLVAQVAS